MQKSDYKSSFHYIALQHSYLRQSFEKFLLYFSNKDIGKLDLAISETILRHAFYKRLGSFYKKNEISCLGELKLIVNRCVPLVKCDAPDVSISKSVSVILS